MVHVEVPFIKFLSCHQVTLLMLTGMCIFFLIKKSDVYTLHRNAFHFINFYYSVCFFLFFTISCIILLVSAIIQHSLTGPFEVLFSSSSSSIVFV